MCSRVGWLLRKDFRELASSRAFLLVALATGPLVGQAFDTAVRTYGEVSGSAGGAAALAQGLSPLDGFLVPVWGAYALVATLLLPFVAIRLISEEKESAALSLLVQSDVSVPAMLAIKLAVMIAAWMLAWIPGLAALALWQSYGGHLAAGETLGVLLGHFVHGVTVVSIAFAAASLADGASSAAVIALAATLGTWALDFIAGVRGGMAAMLARFTPESMLRTHEQGELDARTLLAALLACGVLFAVTATFLPRGRSRAWRARRVAALAMAAIAGALLIARIPERGSALDVSEDRRNSLPAPDAAALAHVPGTLRVSARLGPQDPRLVDLERNVLHKIGRAMHVELTTNAATSTGMFEAAGSGYGEVWYEWNGRKQMTRSTTLSIVLETVYELTGVRPSAQTADNAYPGYPLVAQPRGAGLVFYVLCPLAVLGAATLRRRERTRG